MISLCFISAVVSQADEPRFQATANATDNITPIGGKHVIGVGFYTETTYPLARPYASDTGASSGNSQDMRFQIPVGFGLEASYGITRKFEVAISGGLDFFKTSNLRQVTDKGEKIFDEAKYNLYPIMGILRYRLPQKYWAPEAELGLGAALGTINITATKNPRETQTDSGPFYRGHLAVGTGFSWGEGASLHFQVGYAINRLGAKTYMDSTGYHVNQKDYLQGVFSKAFLSFYF